MYIHSVTGNTHIARVTEINVGMGYIMENECSAFSKTFGLREEEEEKKRAAC